MTAEGMAAASKELAEEERRDPDSVNGNGVMEREGEEDNKEAKIPKTDNLASMDSLFS